MAEQQASKVGMHAFIAADELIGERQAGHEAPLFEPEDGSKGPGKEDTLNSGKSD